MASLVEEVRVDIQCDGDARVAEDSAHLRNIQTEVEDQVARERVA
ncbi:MAG TPA: hypothetical protein VMU55_02530 [Solirubrobacteraceae bacterium]|nr:hypothetical protein [Solirubrobacteraceae bacterium]